ncbi:MAG TPA: hypothetical protein VNU46_05790 [Gemmatimonadaceae bacterium]|nr:hypothetical protein [Gemmatimonadaceae bacterium]
MYENTPWEHLALWGPWLGIGAFLLALILYRVAKRSEAGDPDGGLTKSLVAERIGTLGLSLATLGVLFVIMWRPAHDTYPRAFGWAAIEVAVGSVVIALVVGFLRRSLLDSAITYGMLTASVAAAAAISAFSHSIIAEGQVTAMVLPVGYVVGALGAAVIASIKSRDAIPHEILGFISFLVLAAVASWLLPVVQFREGGADSSTYPVYGGFYIVALGRLSRLWLLPVWAMWGGAVATIAIGYLVASWYGIAIAAIGLSISGALDPRRLPSAESLPPRLTPV